VLLILVVTMVMLLLAMIMVNARFLRNVKSNNKKRILLKATKILLATTNIGKAFL